MRKRQLGLAVFALFWAASVGRAAIYDLTGYGYGNTSQTSPGINFGNVACAPTSATNSFIMLQQKYGINGLMQPAGGGNSSAVNTVNAVGTAMGITAGGVTDNNMITGKINYINNQGLSNQVKVEYQGAASNITARNTASASGSQGIPTLAFLTAQLAAGQDVEVGFNWGNGATNQSGHWVTMDYLNTTTNAAGFIDPSGGQQIYGMLGSATVNPTFGTDPNGTYMTLIYSNGGGASGSGDPPENPSDASSGFIDTVVAESPVPEPATFAILALSTGVLCLRRRGLK